MAARERPASSTSPARDRVETAEKIEQRRLAGAGGPDDGDFLAGRQGRKIDATQHLHAQPTVIVVLAHLPTQRRAAVVYS
jgi:hypothetical protein